MYVFARVRVTVTVALLSSPYAIPSYYSSQSLTIRPLSLTHSLTHSLIHSLIHSLTDSLTHSLTH